MSEIWRDLRTDPPTGDRCVVLFPQITDIGILFTASNPDYARQNALQAGYTHWMEIPPLEGHIEADAEARCAEIRRLDGLQIQCGPWQAKQRELAQLADDIRANDLAMCLAVEIRRRQALERWVIELDSRITKLVTQGDALQNRFDGTK